MKSTISLVAARAWMNICAVATFIMVSHFLGPAEFGMFALASSVSILPHWLVGAGACEFVLGRDPAGQHENTAWTLSVISGAAAAAILAGCGVGTYLIYESNEALIIFSGFALASLMWGLAATLESVLIRDGRGATVAGVGFFSDTAALLALVVALIAGAGIYALVINRLVGGIVTTAGFFRGTGRRLQFSIDRQAAKEILNFSTGIVGTRTVGWANNYGGDVIIGSMLALADVGLFRMGMRIYQAAHAVVLQAPGPAILAAVGRAAAQHSSRMQTVLQRAATLQLALTLPLFVGLAASAGMIVDLVLQPTWRESGAVLAVTCISVPGAVLFGIAATALNASGKSHSLFLLLLTTTPIALAAMYLGASGGAAMVAGFKAVVLLIYGSASVWLIPGITRAAGAQILITAARISAAGVIMFAFCYVLMVLTAGWSAWLRVPAAGVVLLLGLGIYATALRILAPRSARLLKSLALTAVDHIRAKFAARRAPA